ncbi:5'-nucleotidase C-terminal domain-containing protein [Microbacterium sp. YY-01]|uniref:5'-nucleotidase C-terminal domain-containing protein n=1 Tax=Microbacterium sp. YY-01 TaxID=3421634 RepID=UPI003D16D8E1
MKQPVTPRAAHTPRRLAALSLVTGTALALGGAITTPAYAAPEDPVTIDVVTVNDFHGRIEADGAAAGAAVLAGAVQSVRAENPNTVFAAAGDLVGASTFTSFIADDNPTIDALNAAGLEVSATGNHEFDQGWDDLRDRIIPRADWEYISANVFLAETEATAVAPSWVTEFDGVSIGFIGAVTEDLHTLVPTEGIADLDIRDIPESVNAAADALTDGDPANGEADVIILLVHEGAATTSVDSITPESPLGLIVNGVSDKVSAIVSAHTHLAYNHVIDGRPVVSAGQYGQSYGRMTIEVDPDTKELLSINNQIFNLAEKQADGSYIGLYPADPAVQQIVDDAVAEADVLGAVEVGEVTADITRAVQSDGAENRGGESTLGNFIADIHRWTTNADIGVINPGGIRTDLLYGDDGSITYREAASVQPFANTMMTVDLTGRQVVRLLEQQWQPSNPSRPFLKLGVSSNLFYTYDNTAPADAPRISQVLLDGQPIDPEAYYTVGANAFLATGGDSFTVFSEGVNAVDTGSVDLQSMVDWFSEFTTATPDEAQRAVGLSITSPGSAGYPTGSDVTLALSSLVFSQGADIPSTVSVSLAGEEVAVGEIDPAIVDTFDESGQAEVTFTVPEGLDGAQELTITAGATVFSVPFPVDGEVAPTPTITLDPETVAAGDTVTVNGTGFGPFDIVDLDLRTYISSTLGGVDLGQVEADGNGAFTATVTIPADTAAGAYLIGATSLEGNNETTAPLTVTGNDDGGDDNGDGGPGDGDPGDGDLPQTGADPTMPLLGGLFLLLAGAGVLAARRMRRA